MRTTDIADLLKDITPEQLSALAIGLDSIASRPKRIDTSYVSRINRMTQRYFEATKYWRPYYMTTEAYKKWLESLNLNITGSKNRDAWGF